MYVATSAHEHNATRQSDPKANKSQHSPFTRPVNYPRYYDMADVKKQEKDYTKEVDALIPEAQTLAKVCRSYLAHRRNLMQ